MKTRKPYQGRTAVYEFRDWSGAVLYVGVTNNPRRRFAEHAEDKHWWPDVDHDQTRLSWYRTRSEALRQEKRRIHANGLGTLHNHVHNPRRGSPRPRRGSEGYRTSARERSAGLMLVCAAELGAEWSGLWDTPWWGTGLAAGLFGLTAWHVSGPLRGWLGKR